MATLKQKTITSLGWSTAGSFGKQGIQFLISVVLTRLLVPEDFGLLGMILVLTGIATLFNDLGFGAALIHKKSLEERHLSSVFWLNLGVGLFLTTFIIAIAPLVASFYREPQLVSLTRVVAINFFVGAFGIVQKNLFSRHMQFRELAAIDFFAVLFAGCIAITMAFSGFGVWSLVAQLVSLTVLSVLLLWVRSKWHPQFIIQWQAIKELWPFSSNLLGSQLLNYGVRNVDYLLIGRYIGSWDLGIYTRAYTTMLLPINQVTAVVGRVMFPALSRIQDNVSKVKQVYLYSNRMIALITMPLMLGLIVTARPFVLTFFGPKWEAVVPILQVLCLVGVRQTLGSTVGWIYQSQGRTDIMFRWSILSFVVTVVAFVIGLRWGIIGVASAYAVGNYLLWYPAIAIPGRLINMSFKEYLLNVAGVFGCSLAMALVTWILGTRFPNDWPNWLVLTLQVAIGAVTYLGLIHFFRVQAYDEAKFLALEQWHKRRSPITADV
jgi:O-antigen/teichoic acid export membrane protein